MVPWVERPCLELELSLPPRERYRTMPAEAFVAGRRLLEAVLHEMPATARYLADLIRLRTGGRFHDEAVSLAERIGASWRDVLLANVSYDLLLASLGCSTVALPTPDGPVIARNMDWWPEDVLAQTSYLLRYCELGSLRFAHAGWPGAIGAVTGLSARGFAVVLNAVLCPERVCWTGYPVLLHLRRVLEEADGFESALRMLSATSLAAPALIMLVGKRNEQRVVIERSPRRHAHRWASGDEPLVVTNDYRLLFRTATDDRAEIYQTTCSRYDALCRFFAGHRADQPVRDEQLLYTLSDPSIIQTITAQHVILRPRQQQLRLWVPRRLLGTAPETEPASPETAQQRPIE